MTSCARRNDVEQSVRAGQWPQGSDPELRAHVAGCARCAEDARLLRAFAGVRDEAMRRAVPQSAELLWWKAQLRRRRDAMERLERPATAIPVVTMLASVALLVVVLATAWGAAAWARVQAMFAAAAWGGWRVAAAGVVCGFVVVAVVLGVGLAEERA